MAIPDWAVHLIAISIMGIIGAYVRILVKSVFVQIANNKQLTDAEIAPLKTEVRSLRKFSHWSSDSIITLAAKADVTLPLKHE